MHVAAHVFEVVFQLQAAVLHAEAVSGVLHHVVHLRLDHGVGDLYLGARGDGADDVVLRLRVALLLGLLFQLLARLFFICVYALGAGGVFDELVVDGGELLLFDLFDGDGKHRVFALQLFGVVIFGEFDVDVFLFARLHAHHLLFKAGDEGAAAQGQPVVFRRAAFKLDPVDGAGEVDDDRVAVFGGPVGHFHHAGVALLQAGKFCLHVFVLYSILGFMDLYTRVRAQLDVRLDGRLRREDGAFVADVFHRQRGLADDGVVVLFLF